MWANNRGYVSNQELNRTIPLAFEENYLKKINNHKY